MGLIRLLLALSVLVGHAGGGENSLFLLVRGESHVQAFYIISGFYMALLLNGKFRDRPYSAFVTSRLLRLFPGYAAVSLVSLVVFWEPVATAIAGYEPLSAVATVMAQFLFIGQDWAVLWSDLSQRPGTQELAALIPFRPVWVVPQAWSLGVEMGFYLVAPFILGRSWRRAFAVMLLSIAIRLGLAAGGMHEDPWSYRFLPSEMALFLAGALAYKVMLPWSERLPRARWIGIAAVIVLCLWIVGFQHIWWQVQKRTGIDLLHDFRWLFLAAVAVSLPFVFHATCRSRLDRWIGELSYPLYISHVVVIALLRDAGFAGSGLIVAATAASALASIVIAVGIDEPVGRWRERFASGSRGPPGGEAAARAMP